MIKPFQNKIENKRNVLTIGPSASYAHWKSHGQMDNIWFHRLPEGVPQSKLQKTHNRSRLEVLQDNIELVYETEGQVAIGLKGDQKR